MARRYQIYANPLLDRVINARRGEQSGPAAEGPTAILTRAADRYDAVCRHHLPEFSPSEWMAIFDNLNGVMLGDRLTLGGIAANFSDAPELGPKWNIRHDWLARRLGGLNFAELVAVADLTERFWSRAGEFADLDADEIMRRLGS